MESLSDPELLRDHDEVEFHTEVEILDEDEFEDAREDLRALDSHVVVGIVNDQNEVLLQNDGHHGWTLTASSVESGEDWAATARNRVKGLTDLLLRLTVPNVRDGLTTAQRTRTILELPYTAALNRHTATG